MQLQLSGAESQVQGEQMLIRAQDGNIYHRDHITRIAVITLEGRDPDGAGTRLTARVAGYFVEAVVAGQKVPLSKQVDSEVEATQVMDRIILHEDGNLDLMQGPTTRTGAPA
jgi:hypothetical protein